MENLTVKLKKSTHNHTTLVAATQFVYITTVKYLTQHKSHSYIKNVRDPFLLCSCQTSYYDVIWYNITYYFMMAASGANTPALIRLHLLPSLIIDNVVKAVDVEDCDNTAL